MQEVKNGIWGDSKPFNAEQLRNMFKDEQVEHVEVFPASNENLEKAKNREGKKFNYSCGNGYKKVPRINKK